MPYQSIDTMPPPMNYFNNRKSINYTSSSSAANSNHQQQAIPPVKRSNSSLDDYYRKTNKARAIESKSGNSPLFKPLIPKNNNANTTASMELNKTLANVSLNGTTADSALPAGMKIITGSIDKLFKIQKSLPNTNALYEIYGKIITIRDGKHGEKLFLLRNDTGPVLQAVYYEIDCSLPLGIVTGEFFFIVYTFYRVICKII